MMMSERTKKQEAARQQLIDAVSAWRAAPCIVRDGDEFCDGDNHLEECPVERAREDLIAAHNKVEQLRAG